MRCTRPQYALEFGEFDGKHKIKFLGSRADLSSKMQLEARYGKESILALPCGKCISCRMNKAKEWAVRCTLESLDHENNYFITLTYDDDHLPGDYKLHREHLRQFFKYLYNRGYQFRYFGCGEYGGKTKRPHYHLIMFGLDLPDLKSVGAGLSESKLLKEAWPYGFNMIGDVSYESCNYVAQYTIKKVFGDKSDEFLCMSNRPGIGYNWCKEHLEKILKYDAVYGKFGSSKAARLPRYFEKVADFLDHEALLEVKKKRLTASDAITLNEMLVHEFDRVEKLYEYQEQVQIDNLKRRSMRGL